MKQDIVSNINEEGIFALDIMTYHVQRATALNATSVFGTHPGRLVLTVGAGTTTFDTYEKVVDFGGQSVTIRTLRMNDGTGPVDLTSDRVDVTNLLLTNVSTGATSGVIISLTLHSAAPTADPTYASEKTWTHAATIRTR